MVPVRRALSALCSVLSVALAGCARAPAGSPGAARVADARLPHTRAEASGYRETSRYADVVAFVDSLRALGAPVRVGTLGKSSEGRDIPLVVASRPLVSTPA